MAAAAGDPKGFPAAAIVSVTTNLNISIPGISFEKEKPDR